VSAEFVLVASAVGLGVVFLFFAVTTVAFGNHLKRFEYETYVAMGFNTPSTYRVDASKFSRLQRFLREGRHKDLRDTRGASLGRLVLISSRILFSYILLAVLAVGYVVLFVKP